MTRLEQLTALRGRIDLEIQREVAYQARAATLRSQTRAVITSPREWPMRIVTTAAAHFHVTAEDVIGPTRYRDVIDARHIACWLLRDEGRTYTSIGGLVGKDHATVINGVRRVERDPVLHKIGNELRVALIGDGAA